MNTSKTFCNVVRNRENAVMLWLCNKYKGMPVEEAEDIVQESCIDLWIWCNRKGYTDLTETDYVNLWKKFCRNKTSKWLKNRFSDSVLDDEKRMLLPACSDENVELTRRELLYECIERMNHKEKTLITMVLDSKDAIDICSVLGFKDKNVLKNIKCRTIQKMKRDILHRIAS